MGVMSCPCQGTYSPVEMIRHSRMEKRKEGREERTEGGMEGGNKIFKRGTEVRVPPRKCLLLGTCQHFNMRQKKNKFTLKLQTFSL